MEFFGLIAAIVSLIALIVFFVMSSNIGDIKKLNHRLVGQNDQVIRLLNKLVNPNQKTIEEMLKAGEKVYLMNGDIGFRIENYAGKMVYFGKRKGTKEFTTSVDNNHMLADAIRSQKFITSNDYDSL